MQGGVPPRGCHARLSLDSSAGDWSREGRWPNSEQLSMGEIWKRFSFQMKRGLGERTGSFPSAHFLPELNIFM